MGWPAELLDSLAGTDSPAVVYIRLWHEFTDDRLAAVANTVNDQLDGVLAPIDGFVAAELTRSLDRAIASAEPELELLRLAITLDRKLFERARWISSVIVDHGDRRWGCLPRRTLLHDELAALEKPPIGPENQTAGREPWFRFGTVVDVDRFEIVRLPVRTYNELADDVATASVTIRCASPVNPLALGDPVGGPADVYVPVPPSADDEVTANELVGLCSAAGPDDVSVLVLPELSASPAAMAAIGGLEAHASLPALTVIGLAHDVTATGPSLYPNEAVVLDAGGVEIARYRKRTTFAMFDEDNRGNVVREATQIGTAADRIPLVVTPFGTILVSICLDLFHQIGSRIVEDCRPSLIVVPSLSDSTAPHIATARRFRSWFRSVTAIANRPVTAPPLAGNVADCAIVRVMIEAGWPVVDSGDFKLPSHVPI